MVLRRDIILNRRRLLSFIVSLVITAIFLVLALAPVDFARLARAFASADYRLIFLAALFTFCGYILRTVRWQRFLAPAKQVPLARLFPVLVVGFALNNILPGRPGEFARPYALGQREGLSRTFSFGTVVVERVADGLALITFLFLALASFDSLHLRLPELAEAIAAVASAIFGIALGGLVFLLLREQLALSMLQRVTRYLPHALARRIEKMLGSFVIGLHSLRSPVDVAAIAILSLAVWSVEGVSYFLVLSAFNALPPPFTHTVASALMMALINLGIMIPAAPGGLGPYEAAGILALHAFGVNETVAASVSLTAHSMQYVLITGLGLAFAWREGLSLAQVPDPATPSGARVEQDAETG